MNRNVKMGYYQWKTAQEEEPGDEGYLPAAVVGGALGGGLGARGTATSPSLYAALKNLHEQSGFDPVLPGAQELHKSLRPNAINAGLRTAGGSLAGAAAGVGLNYATRRIVDALRNDRSDTEQFMQQAADGGNSEMQAYLKTANTGAAWGAGLGALAGGIDSFRQGAGEDPYERALHTLGGGAVGGALGAGAGYGLSHANRALDHALGVNPQPTKPLVRADLLERLRAKQRGQTAETVLANRPISPIAPHKSYAETQLPSQTPRPPNSDTRRLADLALNQAPPQNSPMGADQIRAAAGQARPASLAETQLPSQTPRAPNNDPRRLADLALNQAPPQNSPMGAHQIRAAAGQAPTLRMSGESMPTNRYAQRAAEAPTSRLTQRLTEAPGTPFAYLGPPSLNFTQ